MSSETLIEQVVESKVQSGECFTAYDITLAVQDKLKTANLFDPSLHRHRHLKDSIHEKLRPYITGGIYERNLQNVGAEVPAFVYHRVGVDPSGYLPQSNGNANSFPPVTLNNYSIPIPASIAGGTGATAPDATNASDSATIALDTQDATDEADETLRTGDKRGTLSIPVRMLKQIGLEVGDKAVVSATETTLGVKVLQITKNPPTDTDELTTYTVDHAGNIRITKAVLKILDDTATQYKVQCDKNSVLVEANKDASLTAPADSSCMTNYLP